MLRAKSSNIDMQFVASIQEVNTLFCGVVSRINFLCCCLRRRPYTSQGLLLLLPSSSLADAADCTGAPVTAACLQMVMCCCTPPANCRSPSQRLLTELLP